MAQQTIQLNLTKVGYIRQDTPGTHYNPTAGNAYLITGEDYLEETGKWMLFGPAAFPSNLKRKKLLGSKITVRLRYGYLTAHAYVLTSDFNPATVTYNSKPSIYTDMVFAAFDNTTAAQRGTWHDLTKPDSFQDYMAWYTRMAALHGVGIRHKDTVNSDDGYNYYASTVLGNSSYPYLTIAYDSDVTIKSKVEKVAGPSGSNLSTLGQYTFQWKYSKADDGYCYSETWAQASAKLYWKTSDDVSWNTVSISGTTLQYTSPAEMFPSGKTIQYYIQGTDEDGTTTQTEEFTFTTASATLTPSNYPSGSGIYAGQALSFTWDLLENGRSLTQTSAVFYWKKQTETNYRSVSVSGNTKRVTIAAGTFPSGQTIQWYLSAVDKAGVTLTCAAKTFSTVAPTVKMVTYPSGSGINYGAVLRFTWDLTSTYGSHAQSAGTLYWRASTSDPWSSISAGTTKGVNVPAYTFPSNTTIYWYVSATDTGGTTSTTSQQNFKTASPVITPQDSPTSGYADPRYAITFRWYFTDGRNSYQQQSAILKWRVSGASTWNTVSASGTTQNVTVAANTFPTLNTIEWMLEGVVRGGTSSQTSVYSFSTTASTAYAICQSPVGRAEDGTKDIILRWVVRNSDGSTPSRTIVKWKKITEAATEWRTVLDTADEGYALAIPAGTFPAGGIDWQVTAYNRDSAAGPTSLASFVCLAAPDAPQGLMATVVPRTSVSWQSSGQEGFEIEIDGMTEYAGYGPNVNSWRREEPLPDGIHLIRVRVQGSYGLWSDWAETSIEVINVPDGTVELTGRFRIDGDLVWIYDGAGDPETVAVYRDGKWIGTATGNTAFTDRFVLGEHEYRVEYWYDNGYYTRSNVLRGSMANDILRIAAYPDGDWMPLKYSEKSDRKQNFNWSQKNATHNITGSPWPVLETAPYENMSASYDCAFTEQDCVRKFEQLRGKIVILKSRGGNVLIGGLMALSKSVNEFYTAFSFTVQQCHWEDFIHDDADD